VAAGAGVIVVGLAVGAFFLGRGTTGTGHHSTSTTTVAPRPAPTGFVTFHDAADGFSLSYPRAWQRVADPAVPLIVSAGGNDAFSVRVLRLQSPVNTNNAADVQAVTNAILSTPGAKLTILGQQAVTVAGIHGYYYFYTFPSGNQVGVHAHYFLFQGRKLTIIVFQALPLGDFQRLAATFDQISSSYKSDPNVLGPTPAPAAPSTTAGGSTSTTAPRSTTTAG
jgi:hypothetical protein